VKLALTSTTKEKLFTASPAMSARQHTKMSMTFTRNTCGHFMTLTTPTRLMRSRLSPLREKIFGRTLKTKTKEVIEAFAKVVKQRLATQPVKIGAQIEVTCYSEGGIDDIKHALKTAQASAKDVKIQLISSPLFLLFTTTIDETRGEQLINDVIDVIHKEITARSGNCKVVKPPSVIGKVDQ